MTRPKLKTNESPIVRVLAASIGLSALLVAPVVQANDDAPKRPATWDMSIEQLQTVGLGQYRGDPVPVPADAPRLNARAHDGQPTAVSQGVIFVNFDGAQLTSGYDDAQNNTTQISNLAGSFAPYGEGSKRDAVMQAVRGDWADYNVLVVDERPASGEYTMNMTGPTNPFGGGVLGIAPLDCDDQQTHSNITFAFHSVNDPFSAATTATTIGQEVAHSYGLEHVNEPGDIMNPYNAGGDPAFIDECIAIVGGQGIVCGEQHARNCGSAGSQNAHAELLDLFGASTPDTQAPTVAIVQPEDGEEFEPGSSFEIVVNATDDTGIDRIELFNNGDALESDGSEPFGWEVDDIPEGTYELFVVASDVAGNETMSDVVTIVVGEAHSEPDGEDSDGEDSAGEDSAGESDGSDGDTDDGAGLPPFGNGDEPDTGCGCHTDGSQDRNFAALALLGLLGFVRRRR